MFIIDFEDTGERKNHVAQVRIWCTCGKYEKVYNGTFSAWADPGWTRQQGSTSKPLSQLL